MATKKKICKLLREQVAGIKPKKFTVNIPRTKPNEQGISNPYKRLKRSYNIGLRFNDLQDFVNKL